MEASLLRAGFPHEARTATTGAIAFIAGNPGLITNAAIAMVIRVPQE